jgi:hypothetical protein
MGIEYSLLSFLQYADLFGLVIAILVLIKCNHVSRLKNKPLFLLYYGVFFLLSLIASLIPDLIKFKSNNWIYDNIPLILCLVLYLFFNSIFTSNLGKKICLVSIGFVILYYFFTWGKAIDRYPNTEFYLIYALFIVVNSVTYLLQELTNIKEESVFNNVEFWFVTSLFFYVSSGTLFWMFFKDIYTRYPNSFNFEYLWAICHNSILFLSCIIFTSAIYLKTRPSR